MEDDSDETEGRKLYRDIANKYARYQINLTKRKRVYEEGYFSMKNNEWNDIISHYVFIMEDDIIKYKRKKYWTLRQVSFSMIVMFFWYVRIRVCMSLGFTLY